jgi:putative ABC transport system substrate-binding protein
MERAAPMLGIGLISVPVRNASELDPRLQAALKAGANALVTMDDSLVASLRLRNVDFSMQNKLPMMGEFRLTAEAGGLISYGPDQVELFRLIAGHVDKILKGANPGDLPVQQPTKFELIINLKTAKALGLTVPPALLTSADEVIE